MNFNEINTAQLDKNLTTEEQKEWNAIYASYRTGSPLSGEISGIDSYKVDGDKKEIFAAVIIAHRIKILIPDEYMWSDKNVPPTITNNTLDAKVDYIIKQIDRTNNFCIASRESAIRIRRREFIRRKSVTLFCVQF